MRSGISGKSRSALEENALIKSRCSVQHSLGAWPRFWLRWPQAERRAISAYRHYQACGLARYVLLLSLMACGPNSERVGEEAFLEMHPIDSLRNRPIGVAARIVNGEYADTSAPAVNALLRARGVLRVGLLEGTPEYVMGELVGAATDEQQRTFVLDQSNATVRVFDRDGKSTLTFGKPGRGPGELTRPTALHLMRDRAYVADAFGLHTFREDSGGFRYQESFSPEFTVESVCSMDTTLFLHGTRASPDSLIYPFDGSRMGVGFGRIYNSSSSIVAMHLGRSRLACSNTTVAIAPVSVLGEVWGFDRNGKPRWIVEIDGFRPISFGESPSGGSRTTIPETGYDRLISLQYVGGYFLAQVMYVSLDDYKGNQRDYTSIFSFLIDEESGQSLSLGETLPLLAAARDRRLIGISNHPYPQFIVYEW